MGPCRECIVGRELLEELAFLIGAQVPAPHLIVVGRAARIHDEGAGRRQRVLERQVDLVGTSRNLADRADRRMDHESVT